MYKIGKAPLVKGGNTTAYPIQLQVTQSHGLPVRRADLPPRHTTAFPLIDSGAGTGLDLAGTDVPGLPTPRPLSDAAQRALMLLQIDTDADPRPPKPEVLPSDATPTPGGELGRLQDIVQGPFLGGDMAQAQQKLLDFLDLPANPGVSARARFYLGQVYFFQGQPRDALMEFLAARDFYFPQCEPWLDGATRSSRRQTCPTAAASQALRGEQYSTPCDLPEVGRAGLHLRTLGQPGLLGCAPASRPTKIVIPYIIDS